MQALVLGEQFGHVALRVVGSPKASACAMQALTQTGVASGSTPGVRLSPAHSRCGRRRRCAWWPRPGGRRPGACAPARSAGRRRSSAARSCARLVGAGHGAVGAADTQVVVDGDNAVGARFFVAVLRHLHARRLVAVLAADRHEGALHVRVLAHLHVDHAPPLRPAAWRLAFAGRGAGLAAPQRRRSATMAQRVMCGPRTARRVHLAHLHPPGRRPSRWRRSGRATSRPAYSGWHAGSPWPAA